MYLSIDFHSLQLKKEALESELSYKFHELFVSLKDKYETGLEKTYLENLDLLKESLKLGRKAPDLDWIEKTFDEIFCSK